MPLPGLGDLGEPGGLVRRSRGRELAAGERPKESESFLPQACPIVASYGAEDRWPGVRETFERLGPALEAAGIDHDMKLYPGAGHGFLNDHDPCELSLWVKLVARLSAAAYDEPSARDARERIIAFFDAHLKA